MESNTQPPDLEFYNNTLQTTLKFKDLPLSELTIKALDNVFSFERMTEVQARCIPPALQGADLIGKARTGSGKTLAFLIPIIELLYKSKFLREHGTGAIIISPTRELALQIYSVARDLLKYHSQSVGLIIGGNNFRSEKQALEKGLNIIVATPGRLRDHLISTEFTISNLQALIIDEADRLLDIGFEDEMGDIVKRLPKTKRQNLLFSATQNEKINKLAKMITSNSRNNQEPIYIACADNEQYSTTSGLEQGYVICPPELRLRLLLTFLRKNKTKKIIVFFSTCDSVKFHSVLFNFIKVPNYELHGKMKQVKRTNVFNSFRKAERGCLFTTDVGARGLDIPQVHWIIQFDPPIEGGKSYIHRVGRTARAGKKGKALLFLMPHEISFLRILKQHKIPLNEYEFPLSKIADVQEELEDLTSKHFNLASMARDAFRSMLLAYNSHLDKEMFDVHQIDLYKLAKAFCFETPPKVHLDYSKAEKKSSKKRNRTRS